MLGLIPITTTNPPFVFLYTAELESNPDAQIFVEQLKKLNQTTVTLFFFQIKILSTIMQ